MFEARAKPFRFDNDDRRRLFHAEASSEAGVRVVVDPADGERLVVAPVLQDLCAKTSTLRELPEVGE